MAEEFHGTARFEVLSCLGAGAMGVVYEVRDRERNARVALKRLRAPTPDALLRFKNEFRTLESVQHPNLVMLGELIEDAGQWFFTMELVDGADFLDYVRPGGALDVERLRHSLRQLASAVAALHAAGKVHRDIKPSNIVVEPRGRLALLDLGLVLDVDGDTMPARDGLAGTAAYMAPEQAVSAANVGPEADWYSVGVILFQALTMALPFDGSNLEVMAKKQERPPPWPDKLADGLPPDLVKLCHDLLATAPDERPSDAQVLRRVGAAAEGSHPPVSGHGAPFVGRTEELDALVRWFDDARGAPVTALVEGHSGVGKTALVQRFIERLVARAPADDRPLVLFGRCHERETVPYKAVDDIVDAIARFLGRLPRDEVAALLPAGVRMLARVFPVLRRVESIAVAPSDGRDPADDRERRTRVFAAFRELLARIATRRRLVLVIDDLQWADADSGKLLREVLRPPEAPSIFLVATVRTGGEVPAPRDLPGVVQRIALAGLGREDALTLARGIANHLGGTADAALARTIADEADGHPLFIGELVRYARAHPGRTLSSLRLEDALWSRVRALSTEVRRLLSVVVLAGEPLPQEVAARAAEARDFTEFARWVGELRSAFLVRSTGVRAHDRVEAYHDRVRAAVLGQMAPELRTICHRRLAIALEGAPAADPEALAYHWRGAGDAGAAARHALDAARRASEAFAFDHAAQLYQLAIDLEKPTGQRRAELLEKLADAEVDAGFGARGAQTYLQAAELAHQSVALELVRRAAEQYLRAGHIVEGMRVLDRVLDPIGMRLAKTPRRALISLVWSRARVRLRGLKFRARDEREVPREQLIAIDTCWAVAVGLALVDPIRASDFQARQLLLALELGEPYRIARALSAEAGHRSVVGGKTRADVLALLERCRSLADELDDPRARALHALTRGISAYLVGRWREAIESCRAASGWIEHCAGFGWERFNARYYELLAYYWTGDLRAFARAVPVVTADADAHGDLLASTTLRNGLVAMLPLLQDDPERAVRESVEVVSRLPDQFNFQFYWQMIALMNAGLYTGDLGAAFDALDLGWERSRKGLAFRVQYIRIEAHWTRGRVRVAAAAKASGAERERLLKLATADVKQLASEGMPYARAKALTLEAGLRALAGDRATAVDLLGRGADAFDDTDMRALAIAARYARGKLAGGALGDQDATDADAWLRAQGVIVPERLVRVWVPGC